MGVKLFAKKTFFVVSLVLVFSSLGRRVWKNLEGARRVSTLRESVSYLEGENKRLEGALSERAGLEFVEKEAREKLGMVKEGEKLVVLPDENEPGMEEGGTVLDSAREIQYWREWVRVFGW